MPIHDWTRVSAGTFHDFHTAWIAELRRALNAGVLPDGYYAMAEQVASKFVPDVLTLQSDEQNGSHGSEDEGGVAIATRPPKVSQRWVANEIAMLTRRQRRLVIRHSTGDRIVALIEIVSPGNKDRKQSVDSFVDKAYAAIEVGYHLLVADLFPPGKFDPSGIHGAIWAEFGTQYQVPAEKPLTLASYVASEVASCYVEPTAVGTSLIDMPLFLNEDHYVNVPLEATYLSAYEGVPKRWKPVIEGTN